MTLEQFVPAPNEPGLLDREEMREVFRQLMPDQSDDEFDRFWAGFVAMKRRVVNPRRRQGTDVARVTCAPVLFDPCQFLVRGGDS